jgi:hypothetical protein
MTLRFSLLPVVAPHAPHGSGLSLASVIMLRFYKKCLCNATTVSMNDDQEQKLFGPPPMKNSKLFGSASDGFTEKYLVLLYLILCRTYSCFKLVRSSF